MYMFCMWNLDADTIANGKPDKYICKNKEVIQ